MKTPCRECVYLLNQSRNDKDPIWEDLYCTCPSVLKPALYDPYSGEFLYRSNSEHYQNIRDVNRGSCLLWRKINE